MCAWNWRKTFTSLSDRISLQLLKIHIYKKKKDTNVHQRNNAAHSDLIVQRKKTDYIKGSSPHDKEQSQIQGAHCVKNLFQPVSFFLQLFISEQPSLGGPK